MSAFRKCGSAYRLTVESGHLWLKRKNGRWLLLLECLNDQGERDWAQIGKRRTLAEAQECARAFEQGDQGPLARA